MSGGVELHERVLGPNRSGIGAILNELALTIGRQHRYDDADRSRAEHLLRDLGCGHLVGRRFSTGSQGERQRMLLARAMTALTLALAPSADAGDD